MTTSYEVSPTAFSGNPATNDGYRFAFASARQSHKGDMRSMGLDTVMSTNDGVWDHMEMNPMSRNGLSPLSPESGHGVEITVERSVMLDDMDLESQDESKSRLSFPNKVSVPHGSPFAL